MFNSIFFVHADCKAIKYAASSSAGVLARFNRRGRFLRLLVASMRSHNCTHTKTPQHQADTTTIVAARGCIIAASDMADAAHRQRSASITSSIAAQSEFTCIELENIPHSNVTSLSNTPTNVSLQQGRCRKGSGCIVHEQPSAKRRRLPSLQLQAAWASTHRQPASRSSSSPVDCTTDMPDSHCVGSAGWLLRISSSASLNVLPDACSRPASRLLPQREEQRSQAALLCQEAHTELVSPESFSNGAAPPTGSSGSNSQCSEACGPPLSLHFPGARGANPMLHQLVQLATNVQAQYAAGVARTASAAGTRIAAAAAQQQQQQQLAQAGNVNSCWSQQALPPVATAPVNVRRLGQQSQELSMSQRLALNYQQHLDLLQRIYSGSVTQAQAARSEQNTHEPQACAPSVGQQSAATKPYDSCHDAVGAVDSSRSASQNLPCPARLDASSISGKGKSTRSRCQWLQQLSLIFRIETHNTVVFAHHLWQRYQRFCSRR